MYNLYDDVFEDKFLWIRCKDSNEVKKVILAFEKKGFHSNEMGLLPHIIVDLKNKEILYCEPSMAATLNHNGVKPRYGYEFLEEIIN